MKNRKRNRMQGFDYSSDNLYFVTICVQDRLCCFGSVGTGRDLSVHHSDANHSDANHRDANHSDANHSDANHSDANHSDANHSDANHVDANHVDANHVDANHVDANHSDSNHSDANHSDANHVDANHVDANHVDANHVDANHSDKFYKKMELNEFGKIIHDRILWLAYQYQYVAIHNFVVMPNHVHVLIEIDSRKLFVEPACTLSTHPEDSRIKSLSSLIGAFKTTSSKMVHQAGFIDFAWQRSFHDHIIRNEKSYFNISNYIDTNPEKWINDTFFE